MQYIQLFEELHKADVRYLVCGGLAVNIYGIPRMTADIDIVLDMEERNVERFDKVVRDLNYQSSVPVAIKSLTDDKVRRQIVQEKNMVAYSYFNARSNYMALDVLLDVPYSFEELWETRESRKLDGFEIKLVGVKQLVELKRYSNRKQDEDDILLLSKLLKDG